LQINGVQSSTLLMRLGMPEKSELKQPPQHDRSNGLDHVLLRQRAYELYVERGMEDGHDVEDWLCAEEELASHEPESVAA
jgi:hypothetical protein